MIIVHALYATKNAEASLRAHLANTLRTMGFKPKCFDSNVWMRKNCLSLPQEFNDYASSGTGTDTNAL